jgi:fumarate reductase subunit C
MPPRTYLDIIKMIISLFNAATYISRHNQDDNIIVQETSALAYICIMSKSVLIMVVLISKLIYVILLG